MKKMMFTLFMLMVSVLSNAQIIISSNGTYARLDMDGDGVWDQQVHVARVPNNCYMRTGRNFYSELGRIYIITQWKMYERMGQNPENYLPNPGSNQDFSAYSGYYTRYIGGAMGGMVPMGGMVGMPGQASIAVGGKNFGFSVSVPVRNRNNMGTVYTPNASVEVNINGNYVGASVPVTVVTGKKKAQRTVQPQRVAPQTQTPTRVVEMSVDEMSQMLNSNDYM